MSVTIKILVQALPVLDPHVLLQTLLVLEPFVAQIALLLLRLKVQQSDVSGGVELHVELLLARKTSPSVLVRVPSHVVVQGYI